MIFAAARAWVVVVVVCGWGVGRLCAADLSPGAWPAAERERLETLGLRPAPGESQIVTGDGAFVSAAVSPVAAYAGIQAMKQGGSAADAAVTTALTQVSVHLGSTVSYAGVFTMLYYDAKAGKVFSLDAGYNSYLGENDPRSIPVSDQLRGSPAGRKPTEGGAKGRETLVPGFMAGIEALRTRFGRLPLSELLKPAIWYAENGVKISPSLKWFFDLRAKHLGRTPEGREFMGQAGGEIPAVGTLFKQPVLARTLAAVSEHGAAYMYTGEWARNFVDLVRREGGQATRADLERYRPIWSEPFADQVFGCTVCVNGPPLRGVHGLFVGLNLAEALHLDRRGSYWTDPVMFARLVRVAQFATGAPRVTPAAARLLRDRGVDFAPAAQLEKNYATAVAPLLDEVFAPPAEDLPRHSHAIVAVDREGNIAVVTHSINTLIWGDTGIVVDGVPLPDSAGFQQSALAKLAPGERLPSDTVDTIVLRAGVPILATASIGASLMPENIRMLVSVLGQHQDLAGVMAAPPLLSNVGPGAWAPQPPALVPAGAYERAFLDQARRLGIRIQEVPVPEASNERGTLAVVAIDPKTGRRTGVDSSGIMIFNMRE